MEQLPQTVPDTQPKGYLEDDYGCVSTVSNIGMYSTAFGLVLICFGLYAVMKARKFRDKLK